jgi:predicted CXXCH cytochrome family protein
MSSNKKQTGYWLASILIIGVILIVFSSFKKVSVSYYSTDSCSECHGDYFKKDFIHAPVSEDCSYCHESTGMEHPGDSKGFRHEEQSSLCYMCHDAFNSASQIHAPVEEGFCTACHAPHASMSSKLLNSEDISSMCFECHELNTSKHSSIHQPVKNGDCQQCHDPHLSNNKSLLIESGTSLCLSCHNKEFEMDGKVYSNIASQVKDRKNVHSALELDGCATCHNSHSSENIALLNAKYPQNDYVEAKTENFELCFTCHDSKLMTEEFTTSASNFRHGNVNMHYLHINGEKGRNCSLCHEVHASDNPFLIAHNSYFGKIKIPMLFSKTDMGGKCQAVCHSMKQYDREFINTVPGDISSSESVETTGHTRDTINPGKLITENTQTGEEKNPPTPSSDSVTTIGLINNDTLVNRTEVEDNFVDSRVQNIIPDANIENDSVKEESETLFTDNPATDTTYKAEDTIKPENLEQDIIENVTQAINNKESDNQPVKTESDKIVDELNEIEIYFSFDASNINNIERQKLNSIISFMLENKDFIINVIGYTDNSGDEEYNNILAENRAKSVATELMKSGINNDRIKIVVEGENKPKYDNSTVQGRKSNRRVGISLYPL